MAKNITIYLPLPLKDLEALIEGFKEDFDGFLDESFTSDELTAFEKLIDELAALYVQPILHELTFDDFYADPSREDEQRSFFGSCRSSLLLENLPFLETNPFQVTYLRMLLDLFPEALVDQGGVSELTDKQSFLESLKKYKSIDLYQAPAVEKKPIEVRTTKPVDPIDFLILDVYKEFDRLDGKDLDASDLSLKVRRIYQVMKDQKMDSTQLLKAIGLNPKDFDDGLERLKFWLRKH